MKHKTLILIFFFGISALLKGQEYSTDFGDISLEELEMKNCTIDSTADAFVIHDIGLTKFIKLEGMVYFKTTRQTRIKILNKSAYDRGLVEIPFWVQDNISENIYDIKAIAVNYENGHEIISELNKKDVYKEDINKFWKQKKFAIPDVREGTVIEYTYTIESPWKVHLRDWYFQDFIPTLYNRFQIEITPFYEYHLLLNKYMEFSMDTVYTENDGFFWSGKSYPNRVFIWEMRDVPAFNDEAFITTVDDYVQKAEFQLSKEIGLDGSTYKFITSWEDAIKKLVKDPFLNDHFGQYIKAASRANKDIIEELKINTSDTLESIKSLLQYTRENFKWNNSTGMTTSQSKRDFLQTKTGTAADINLFFLSLLRSAGYEAYPLLLSTRDHGKVFLEYPFLQNFNYIVVKTKVDGKTLYLDATDPFLPYNLLPQRCLNEYGMQVKLNEEVKWFPLVDQVPSNKSITYLLNYDPEIDSIVGQVVSKLSGYFGQSYRKTLSSKKLEGIKDRLLDNRSGIELTNLSVQNKDELEKDLLIQSDISISAEKIGNRVFISPMVLNSLESNPLKFKERYYPLNLNHQFYKKVVANIQIPVGYEVDFVPESEQFFTADNQALFAYSVKLNGQFIQIMSEEQITTATFPAKYYLGLKDYFQKIVDKQGEKIVLRKIKN
jgi:hypothetical protein